MKKILMAVALVAVFAGCEEKKKPEPPKPEVYTTEGNGFMKDPAFQKKLDESVKLRNTLLAERQKLNAARKALLAKYGNDEKKASADPEWAKLAVEIKISDQKLADRNAAARDLARNRMLQAAEDAKKVAAGTAVPKK